MEYEELTKLEKFVDEVDNYLVNNLNGSKVSYPEESISPWNSDDLIKANSQLLNEVAGKANVYAIFTSSKDSNDFILRYLGKTKKKLARERIKNHLVKKHKKTGAKLSKVIDHIQSGGKIKISWVSITPESLRNYIEEELISRHKEANWNRENA